MTDGSRCAIEIFTEAVRLPIEERTAFLNQACAGDEGMRRKIDALLKSNDRAGDFLEQPAAILGEDGLKRAPGERPGDQVDRYKLLGQIGEGGCGIVFLAEQEIPVCRRVALKIIKPGMDTKSVIARFEAERQALALMDHPNVARVFDAGATVRGLPYFVMELVEGVKITDYCDQHSLPTSARLELFIQVCDAIQHAHQKGIIHRDIKPSNILVAADSAGKPTLKVIDFGIAKATAGHQLTEKTILTANEMLIGTPAYMSPEQAAMSTLGVDTRADIYSLGVVLYELLTGTTPFDVHELLKSGFDEVRRVIREEEPVRASARLTAMSEADFTLVCQRHQEEPSTLLRRLRGDLDWIVMKTLEKDRSRRYETATGLLKDIQRFLANEPVSARPPNKLYTFKKAVLRNKLLFSGMGIIAVLLLTGLIIVSASREKQRRARLEAEAATIESQQVTAFLEDALQGVEPSFARGEDTTMLREILDRAVERIDTGLTNQPAEDAELCNVIGTVYGQIGNYRQAEKMHRESVDICQEHLAANDPRVADSLNALGYDLQAQYKDSEAERAFSEALAIRRQLFGETNALTAASMDNLGGVYRDEGKLVQAEVMIRRALEIRENLFTETNIEVANSLRNLCLILGKQSKWAESEAMARKALAIHRQLLGPTDPSVASALNDVAWAVGAQGNIKEEETLRREALEIRQKLLPAEDPDVAQSLSLVGDSMRKNGNPSEAVSVLSTALSIQNKVLGEDDPASLETLHDLGLALGAEGKWSDAEAVDQKVLDLWRKRSGNESQQALFAMSDLETAFEKEHKWPEAETLDRDSWALSRKILGVDEPHTLYLMDQLAIAFEADGKWSDADSACREALAGLRGEAGDHHESMLHTLWLLDSILQGEGKWPEEESVLREELVLLQKLQRETDPDTLHTMGTLGYALKKEHKFAEAESIHRQALAQWRKLKGDVNPETLYAIRNLADTLGDEGKLPEEENLYREEFESWRKLNGDEDQQTFYTRRMLGLILEAEGKWPEAETVFRQSLALSRKKGDEDPEAMADLEHLVIALMPQKKFGDAEQLLDEVLTPKFVNDPSSADLIVQRVNLMGRQQRWREATADAALLMRLEPADHYNYHRSIALAAISQDQSSYEQLCGKMAATFTNTANPYVDERIADDCLLLPHSGVDLKLADNLASQAVTRGSNETALAYFQACKAISDYRLGYYVQAIKWAKNSTNNLTTDDQAKAKAFAVLAMAEWQLGQKDAARAALLNGDTLAPRISPETGAVDLGESWVAWLMARISLDEATALINTAPLAEIKSGSR